MRKRSTSRASGDSKKSSSRKNSKEEKSFRASSSSRSRSTKSSGTSAFKSGDRRKSSNKKFSSEEKPTRSPYSKSSRADKTSANFKSGDKRRSSDKRYNSEDKPLRKSYSRDSRSDKSSSDFKPGGKRGSSDKKYSTEEKPLRRSYSKDSKSDRSSSDFKAGNKRGGFGKRAGSDERPSRFSKPSASKFSDEKRPKRSFSDAPAKRSYKTKESKPEYDESLQSGTEKVRLNKYIANSGICSRREADQLIGMGLVSVNGTTVTELGYKVNPGDVVKYEGKTLRAEKPVYILLNKPKGYLTTTKDPQERNTVMHILGSAVKERVYPVGRLDRNTTGLLLLTNDGDLAEKLSHPSYNVKKIYKVDLDRPLTRNDYQKIMEGIHLEEGRAMVDDLAIVSDDGKTVGIELHIGWNRVVRRIFESLDYTVIKLDRSVYAGLDKKELSRGQWRFLKKEEVVRLKHFK